MRREVCAQRVGGEWRLFAREKRFDRWEPLEQPPREDWLELLGESGFFPEDGLAVVRKETGELKGIFISIVRNTKAKSKPPKS